MVDARTRELRLANARLRELDELKSEFVSRVSHELRSPLTVMQTNLAVLLERDRPPRFDAVSVGCILYLAIFGTAVTFGLYFWLLKPVAKTYGLCQDEAVNGCDFFVMACVEGVVLHDGDAAATLTDAERQSFGRDVADVLVRSLS